MEIDFDGLFEYCVENLKMKPKLLRRLRYCRTSLFNTLEFCKASVQRGLMNDRDFVVAESYVNNHLSWLEELIPAVEQNKMEQANRLLSQPPL